MFEGVEVLFLSTSAGQQEIMKDLNDLRLWVLSYMFTQVKSKYGVK